MYTPPLDRHPPGRHPPGRHPPLPEMATAADGTHPTGMHFCVVLCFPLSVFCNILKFNSIYIRCIFNFRREGGCMLRLEEVCYRTPMCTFLSRCQRVYHSKIKLRQTSDLNSTPTTGGSKERPTSFSVQYYFSFSCTFYRPQTKLRKGNVFTPVCQSFCSQGVSASVHAGIHPRADGPGQTSPGQTPPHAQCMLGYTHTPPSLPSACWDRHGYCCRRFASYWNAFLLKKSLLP